MTPNTAEASAFHKLQNLALGVAQFLGDGWVRVTLLPPDSERGNWRKSEITRTVATGVQSITFTIWWNDFNKVTVRGHTHPGHEPSRWDEEKTGKAEIGVSLSRDHVAVAKDIQRRLLPAYEALWAMSSERKAGAETFQTKRAANVAKVLSIMEPAGASLDNRGDKNSISFYNKVNSLSGGFEMSADNVSVKLDCSLEFAMVIARLVAANLVR